jgi:hypothetical protein
MIVQAHHATSPCSIRFIPVKPQRRSGEGVRRGRIGRRRRQAGGALARKRVNTVLGVHFAKAPGTRSTPRLAAAKPAPDAFAAPTKRIGEAR